MLFRSHELERKEITIQSVPGASALTAALSVAGVPISSFSFLGFLPHKKGRETLIREIVLSPLTAVFYESPHRILKALISLEKHCSAVSAKKQVVICRELTKVYEEVVRGSPAEVLNRFSSQSDKVRGEFVVIVANI